MNNNYTDYLCHYGVIGMKWGVRNYQNPDGTLTTKGKERYGSRPYDRQTKKQESRALRREMRNFRETERDRIAGETSTRVENRLKEKYGDNYLKRRNGFMDALRQETDRQRFTEEETNKIEDLVDASLREKYGNKAVNNLDNSDLKIGLALAGTMLAAYGAMAYWVHKA